jgi:hypothetical protein
LKYIICDNTRGRRYFTAAHYNTVGMMYLISNFIQNNFLLKFCVSTFLHGVGKAKVKAAPGPFLSTEHHAMKAYWGSVDIAPCIIDLDTRWR